MKLKLIATSNNFTVEGLFKAFPSLKDLVEAYVKLSYPEQDDSYEGFKKTVNRMVGEYSTQDQFDKKWAYRTIIRYATSFNPKLKKKITLDYKPEPLPEAKYDLFGNHY